MGLEARITLRSWSHQWCAVKAVALPNTKKKADTWGLSAWPHTSQPIARTSHPPTKNVSGKG